MPRRRREGEQLVDNDVSVAGMIHKIGWRGLPSLALEFGEREDCHGWLVGAPGRGLACMFQMMNEARLMVGANGVATASVAYHEAVSYARERPQGRPLTKKTSAQGLGEPQVPIVEHADVRRMLLRQKAIVEGGLSLIAATAYQADLAEHASTEAERQRAALLLDLLTPVAKSFPAERGFEANALALQVHGGYGYSSEFLPEAWLRDQKLNSIHEGTTGIQGLDLLGRKVMAQGGAALQLLTQEIAQTLERAQHAGVARAWTEPLQSAVQTVGQLTLQLAHKGLGGEVEAMLLHSADYLELLSILIVGWQWLQQAAVARTSPEASRRMNMLNGNSVRDAGFGSFSGATRSSVAQIGRVDRVNQCAWVESPAPTGSPSSPSRVMTGRRCAVRSPSTRSDHRRSPAGPGRWPMCGYWLRSWPAR